MSVETFPPSIHHPGVTYDHMDEISISASQVGTWDLWKKFSHPISVGDVEARWKAKLTVIILCHTHPTSLGHRQAIRH